MSILRGFDGTVIATRRVAAEGVRVPAELSFVAQNDQGLDTLVIEPPEGPPILVSNIDGDRLNSPNSGVVSEATRLMSIRALVINDTPDIRAMRGVRLSQQAIRFAKGSCQFANAFLGNDCNA